MKCSNCDTEITEKHTKRRKYCSDSCRVSSYIKRANYKPLGNIRQVEASQIVQKPLNEAKNGQGIGNSYMGAMLANTTFEAGKAIFTEPTLTRKEFNLLKKELFDFLKNQTIENRKNFNSIHQELQKLKRIDF
jgi:hypothetical protein